ncbi:16S rRNA (guanine(966)-N(2))-methyltransferase RsmD [Salinicola tamaricis]|uniref:16S rRNA (guanine(966)-N(2))-methyltransferase RsmD n=1 Tax=Salinicola tamaricis TaxID=1771309 RepID=UPI000D099A1F|nr:16S rRNA (guanine(966)-N(2))-methyltransferase RsmD [Salinicola tamaricis]
MNRRRSQRGAPGGRATSPAADGGRRGQRASHGGRGELRLIGGEFRRRRLPILDSPGLRPTPGRVRETLFNWLAFELAGTRVLDLFAGTGALGLEALSRGAGEVHFVEAAAPVAAALTRNLDTLGAQATVHRGDVAGYLAGPATPCGLVFLDPPFRQGLAAATCERLEQGGWLTPLAWIYVETEHELAWQPPPGWQLHRELRAGDSHARLFRRTPPGA